MEKKTIAIRNALISNGERWLRVNDPPSIDKERSLNLSLINQPVSINRPENSDWNDLPTCRREFKSTEFSRPIDICLGVLESKAHWGKDFKRTGKKIYLSIIMPDAPLRVTGSSGDLKRAERIEIEFALGEKSNRIALVNKAAGSGNHPVPTLYLITDRVGGLPLKESVCQLRTPSSKAPRSIYLCHLAFRDIPIFRRLADMGWPPSEAVRDKLRARVAAFASSAATGKLIQTAGTYELRSGHVVDKPGIAITSIDELVTPSIDDGVEACLIGANKRLLWKSGGHFCPAQTAAFGQSAKSSEECRAWCMLSKLIFTHGNNKVRHEKISGNDGPSLWIRYNEQKTGEIWLRKNASRAFFLILLIAGTCLVYSIVFRWILKPIQQLSNAVEAASIDLTRRVVIPQSSSSDEIGILTRAFNALLARVTDVVEVEVHNLRMIGHDVRSPLQSLLAMPQSDESYRQIKRIQNAIERFEASRTPRDAFEQVEIGTEREDLAAFLKSLVVNAIEYKTFDNLEYQGPANGVFIDADIASLEDVVAHILDNGRRFRLPGTSIKISLSTVGDRAIIDIDNQGPRLSEDMLKSIFEYGVTTQGPDTRSLGQGLYAAKAFVTTMAGTIEAINLDAGMRFQITFPTAGSE